MLPQLDCFWYYLLDLPIRVGVRHGGPIDADVVFIAESEELLPSELRAIVLDNGVGTPKHWTMLRKNSRACSDLITEIG